MAQWEGSLPRETFGVLVLKKLVCQISSLLKEVGLPNKQTPRVCYGVSLSTSTCSGGNLSTALYLPAIIRGASQSSNPPTATPTRTPTQVSNPPTPTPTRTPAPAPAPAAPSNVQAQALSGSSIRLAWNDNANNETGFSIHDESGLVATVDANSTSYTVTGLPSETWKCHRIRAYNNNGNSDWSDWGCTYTLYGYFDDFSNSNSGWFDNGDSMGYASGEYEIRVDNADAWTGVISPYVGSMDYTLEADMRLYSGDPIRYGLVFDMLDWDHFYVFTVNPTAQNYSVLRRDGSNWITIADNTSSSSINSGNASNHLEVTVIDNLFEVRVNGQNLGIFNGGAYSGDLWVGLYAKSGTGIPVTARYDNLSLEEVQVTGRQQDNRPHSDKMLPAPPEAIWNEQE